MYPFILCVFFFCLFFIQPGYKEVPRVILEVKRSVPSLKRINPNDLVQLFVQGFYAMERESNENVVLVLSDGTTFHIFGVALGPESPLLPLVRVKWHTQLDNRKDIVDFLAVCLDNAKYLP